MRTLLLLAAAFLCAPAPARGQMSVPSYEIRRVHDTGPVAAPTGSAATFAVDVPGAPWLQVRFSAIELPAGALLRLTARDGAVQEFDRRSAREWGGRSAYFNGDLVLVEVLCPPEAGTARVVLERVVVGLPAPLLSICAGTDDRTPSNDPRVARVMPIRCTAWLIQDCNHGFLSAGHCAVSLDLQTVQFNVPPSLPDGTVQHPPPADQFPVDAASLQYQANGPGADWAYFGCFANASVGQTPYQRQQAAFALQIPTAHVPGATLRVTGHGYDESPFTSNHVQQAATGPWTGLAGSALYHQADTLGGNSGSPVVLESSGVAIAIHTHGGCDASGAASNQGTALGQAALQAALAAPRGVLSCTGTWSTYCTAKVNSQGCTPQVGATGTPSAAGGPGSFTIRALQVLNLQNGVFFYGLTPAATPFQGGTLCVAGQVTRTPIQNAGGNPTPGDCSGQYVFDMGARIAAGTDPRLVQGATVVGQFWSRDPQSLPFPSGLTDAIRFTIGP